jgi:hypothetical protein
VGCLLWTIGIGVLLIVVGWLIPAPQTDHPLPDAWAYPGGALFTLGMAILVYVTPVSLIIAVWQDSRLRPRPMLPPPIVPPHADNDGAGQPAATAVIPGRGGAELRRVEAGRRAAREELKRRPPEPRGDGPWAL